MRLLCMGLSPLAIHPGLCSVICQPADRTIAVSRLCEEILSMLDIVFYSFKPHIFPVIDQLILNPPA